MKKSKKRRVRRCKRRVLRTAHLRVRFRGKRRTYKALKRLLGSSKKAKKVWGKLKKVKVARKNRSRCRRSRK